MIERIKNKELAEKVMDPIDAVKKYFPKDGVIAFGGMAGTAIPKVIPRAINKYLSLVGEKLGPYIVFTGGSVTLEFDDNIMSLPIERKYPVVGGTSKLMKDLANKRVIKGFDMWLFDFYRQIRRGVFKRKFGNIKLAIIEISEILEDSTIVPSLSLDASPAFIEDAEKVIFELNTARPNLEGLHDIYFPKLGEPIPIKAPMDRIGNKGFKISPDKIAAIVYSNEEDSQQMHYSAVTQTDYKVISNLLEFLNKEISEDPNLRSDKVTIQPGAGPIASALARKINELSFSFHVWGEVCPTSWIPLLSENLKGISTSVIYTLPGENEFKNNFYNNMEDYKKYIVIRPYEITNNAEIINRFIHINIQQALEVDIFGNVNISRIGNYLYGGVGGSGDHAKPAYLTIIAINSTTSSGISKIVPLVSHVDIVEQDVDVIVTEYGYADLRFLSPLERAKKIIENCVHPKFKSEFEKYIENIEKMQGYEPVDFQEALKFRSKA
jgi:acyl-CoA hydrolase